MFSKLTHAGGVVTQSELLFTTPFDYLFPDAARSAFCLLPATEATRTGLMALGAAMADTGSTGAPQATLDSDIPAGFTYLGQFIDHDLTARTDRESAATMIGGGVAVQPQDPDQVVATLRNGRRPQLDLDSVFGDGPGLVGTTESETLFDADLQLRLFEPEADRIDLLRTATGPAGAQTQLALVGDQRNDENIVISQLHSAFLRLYNVLHDAHPGKAVDKYVRARQLVRWCYQYLVVHDYLTTVCDPGIVSDTLANGPRHVGATAGRGGTFMPLEFSVAGFRFAHSMIRPFYTLSGASGKVPLVDSTMPAAGIAMLGVSGNPHVFAGDGQLRKKLVIEWENFVGPQAQHARRLDTKIAQGLFTLPLAGRSGDPVLASLSRSNLLRSFNLSIPTGQAMCDAFSITALTPAEILGGEDPAIAAALQGAGLQERSPLWYYVLREAAVQQNGQRLGELGSRLVCEVLVGMLKGDPNSYLNNQHDPAVTPTGIAVGPQPTDVVATLADFLRAGGFAGV